MSAHKHIQDAIRVGEKFPSGIPQLMAMTLAQAKILADMADDIRAIREAITKEKA